MSEEARQQEGWVTDWTETDISEQGGRSTGGVGGAGDQVLHSVTVCSNDLDRFESSERHRGA